jgi:putative nucleotidyltransferase with HDIG domain
LPPPVASKRSTQRTILLSILLLLFIAGVLLALLVPLAGYVSEQPLEVGQVAPYDIHAPYAITYESQALTNKQREDAASTVLPIYTPPDTAIARQQLEHLKAALAYIDSVRADSYASEDQKLIDLAALEDIQLERDVAVQILEMSEGRWQSVSQEAVVVLERVMRNTIRQDQLEENRQQIPSLVSLSLSEDQAVIVTELVGAFVVPNSVYDEALTEATRQQARDAVKPVTRSFISGENILQRGQLISESDLEALNEYGLAQTKGRWQDLVSAAVLTLLVCAYFIFFLHRRPQFLADKQGLRKLTVHEAFFILILLGGRLIIPGHTVLPFVYPVMAYALTVAALFGTQWAIISVWPLAILMAYDLPSALGLTIYYALSSIFGVWALRRAQRVTAYFGAGAAIALSGALISTAYQLLEPTADWMGLATLAGAAVVNGVASASISLILHYALSQLLGMTTGLQLIELSRPDHPLMQYILRNAPGTYQHSLQLANLVEQAAERIGADAQLVRVGALYHDAGKSLNPYFFIENQPTADINPHDDLDPAFSAATIIRHVTDGIELAHKHHLPQRIQDFIREHHGTQITRYQYTRAVEAAGGDASQVDPERFRYPGPRPQSRETALLMLADGCEARMRAEHPKNEEELHTLIKSVVDNRRESGQLDDTDLTLRDLNEIIDSFTTTLRGVYHPRIPYPKLETETQPEEAETRP